MDSKKPADLSQNRISRARRYAIGAALRYRVSGEQEWREGVMENISISGVLLRAAKPLAPNTMIELRFSLPVELHGESAADVLCRGSVVRSSHRGVPGGPVNIAARIVHSRFVRQMGQKEAFATEG